MSLTENDLEVLETYLDGELPPDAAAALAQKLGASPELVGGLEMLRAERAARAQAWRSFEPSALELDRLTDRLERSIGQQPLHPVWDRVLSIGRLATAAAACIVMGIAIGRIGSGRSPVIAPGGGSSQVAGAASSTPQVPADVILTDDTGRIFVQRFPSAQAARQFVEDLHRAREQQLREAAAAPPQAPEQF